MNIGQHVHADIPGEHLTEAHHEFDGDIVRACTAPAGRAYRITCPVHGFHDVDIWKIRLPA